MNNKKGMALIMALVFAVVLLEMAVAYSGMTKESKPQTVQIDERDKLAFLAKGITELAVLKFRLFPSDYYACWEAHEKYNYNNPLLQFTVKASEFSQIGVGSTSNSSFNNVSINVQLATMAILTTDPSNKWNTEALLVKAYANYTDQYGRLIQKDAVKIVSAQRQVIK